MRSDRIRPLDDHGGFSYRLAVLIDNRDPMIARVPIPRSRFESWATHFDG